jgi:hypothetical protein
MSCWLFKTNGILWRSLRKLYQLVLDSLSVVAHEFVSIISDIDENDFRFYLDAESPSTALMSHSHSQLLSISQAHKIPFAAEKIPYRPLASWRHPPGNTYLYEHLVSRFLRPAQTTLQNYLCITI